MALKYENCFSPFCVHVYVNMGPFLWDPVTGEQQSQNLICHLHQVWTWWKPFVVHNMLIRRVIWDQEKTEKALTNSLARPRATLQHLAWLLKYLLLHTCECLLTLPHTFVPQILAINIWSRKRSSIRCKKLGWDGLGRCICVDVDASDLVFTNVYFYMVIRNPIGCGISFHWNVMSSIHASVHTDFNYHKIWHKIQYHSMM